MYTGTFTASATDTFTESRARYVLGKIFDDFNGIIFRGFTTVKPASLKEWRDDIQYIMEQNALYHFEIQFQYGLHSWAVRSEVNKYGGITRDDSSGGLDFYNIPAGASLNIVVNRDTADEAVSNYLARRGWTSGGAFIAEGGNSDRAYSKDGFGVNRKKLGDF